MRPSLDKMTPVGKTVAAGCGFVPEGHPRSLAFQRRESPSSSSPGGTAEPLPRPTNAVIGGVDATGSSVCTQLQGIRPSLANMRWNHARGFSRPVGNRLIPGGAWHKVAGSFQSASGTGAVYPAIPKSATQISPRCGTVSSLSNKTKLSAAIAVGLSSKRVRFRVFIAGFDIMKGLRNRASRRGTGSRRNAAQCRGVEFPILPGGCWCSPLVRRA